MTVPYAPYHYEKRNKHHPPPICIVANDKQTN